MPAWNSLPPAAEAGIAQLSLRDFRPLADYITRELGIKMSEHKIPMLQGRLQRRIRALGLGSFEDYRKHLFESGNAGQELADFIDAVTTNKTEFLRERQHFDYLTETALPSLDPGPGQSWKFKIWCAGCSTGEEAYTLAMVLSEFAEQRGNCDFSIFATDISNRVLRTAQAAIYDEARIEPVPEAWRKKYLLRSRDAGKHCVRVDPRLRSRVHFSRLNFMDADYGLHEQFDAVFFRNVMIYFDQTTQEAVVGRLCRQLHRDRYLFIGHSESLLELALPLQMVFSAVYRRT